jgi:hypothetical protein
MAKQAGGIRDTSLLMHGNEAPALPGANFQFAHT